MYIIEYCQNRSTFLRYSYINSSHEKATGRIMTSAVLEIKLLLKNDDMIFGVYWP